MKRVTNGFNKLNLATFNFYLGVIISSMTNNPYFADLQATVAALKAEADNFTDLVVKASKRDQDAILRRDVARAKITDSLHVLGSEVTAIAKGNETILTSSGFKYTQTKQKTAPLVKPDVPSVSLGINRGEIICKTESQAGMVSVSYYITTDPTAVNVNTTAIWEVKSFNKIKFKFTNLISGKRYYIKVGLVGVRGQEVTSDVVSYISQ